jgi:hypothetical protein
MDRVYAVSCVPKMRLSPRRLKSNVTGLQAIPLRHLVGTPNTREGA